MYDPIELSRKIEKLVIEKRGGEILRKYYRFRPAEFYGGIASADCVGCNLRCIYCWSNDLAREGKMGRFFSPTEVASKLVEISKRFGFSQVRITGNEPTISREHLLSVLEKIPLDLTFILETNGLLLGYDEGYVEELKKFKNLYVRVSLKGCNDGEFSTLTGAEPKAFELQLKALENCVKHKIPCHPAIMIDLVKKENLKGLAEELKKIDKSLLKRMEFENLLLYPHVAKRLEKFKG